MTSAQSSVGSYQYDANGNMTCRTENGVTYQQTYNAENRLSSIIKLASGTCAAPGNNAAKWDFTYDGDGTRTAQLYTPYVNGTPGTAVFTAYFFGGMYETRDDGVIRKYYAFAGATFAMRAYNPATSTWTLNYFLTDQLGSVDVVLSATGTVLSQQRYLPFGRVRTLSGTNVPSPNVPGTDFGYTSQRALPETGLIDFKARMYSPVLGRFLQPDTMIPSPANPQAWNRYSYVLNRPIRFDDPTGHCPMCVSAAVGAAIGFGFSYASQVFENYNSRDMDLSEAMSFENIDTDKLIVATIGGAVGGATMGLAAPALAGALGFEAGAYMLAGATSNAMAGAAESITKATIQHSKDGSSSWGLDHDGFMKFRTDVYDAGLNEGKIAYDFGSGGLLSLGAYGVIRPFTGPISKIPNAKFFDDVYFASKGYLVGGGAEVVKIIADTGKEASQKSINRIIQNYIGRGPKMQIK